MEILCRIMKMSLKKGIENCDLKISYSLGGTFGVRYDAWGHCCTCMELKPNKITN